MVRDVNAASGLALSELVCVGREGQQCSGFGYRPSQPRAALALRPCPGAYESKGATDAAQRNLQAEHAQDPVGTCTIP